jgi:hypothetical protein
MQFKGMCLLGVHKEEVMYVWNQRFSSYVKQSVAVIIESEVDIPNNHL